MDTIKRSTEKRPQKTHKPQFEGLRLKLWEIIRSNQFEAFILGAIIINVLMMATFNCVPDAEAQACVIEPLWAEVWRYSNYLFSLIFLFEMAIKLSALGLSYFSSGWNCFDMFLVCASVVDLSLEVVPNPNPNPDPDPDPNPNPNPNPNPCPPITPLPTHPPLLFPQSLHLSYTELTSPNLILNPKP